jgi:hypothetical protein
MKPTHLEKPNSPQEAQCGAKRGWAEALKFETRRELVTCSKCKRIAGRVGA